MCSYMLSIERIEWGEKTSRITFYVVYLLIKRDLLVSVLHLGFKKHWYSIIH